MDTSAQVERSAVGALHDGGDQKNKFCREAEECRRSAKRATSPIHREAWLRLADDWMKLARGEDLRIEIAGLKGLRERVGVMHNFVARANIDHYLGLLDEPDLPRQNRATITKLLIEEEDKLGRDLEQLRFAEDRTAMGRVRVSHFRALIAGSTDRARAEKVLADFETIQRLLEHFCHQMRERVNSQRV